MPPKIEERSPRDIEDEQLQYLARLSGEKHYILTKANREVGLLSVYFNDKPNPAGRYLEVSHLYVIHEYRKSGYGTILIKKAEEIAQELHYPRIALKPSQIDENGPDLESLRIWYAKHGYTRWSECDEMMSKRIYSTPPSTSSPRR